MDIPHIPTDNLYKFISLSGVAIFLLFIVFSSQKLIELSTKSFEISKSIAVAKVDCEEFKQESSRELYFEPSKFNYENLTKQNYNQQRKLAEIAIDNEQLRSIFHFQALIFIVLAICAIISSFMIKYGFSLWYYQVQLPQDDLLQKQIILIEKQISSFNSEPTSKDHSISEIPLSPQS